MKKVLFITVRADMGGGPKHVFDLCSNLKNIEVYIAAPNEEPFFSKYEQIAKGIIEIPHRKFSLVKFIKLLMYCREQGINIVHSHGRGAGIYSRLLGLFGMRVIHTFHGVHRVSLVEKCLRYLTDKFICVSESEKENALQFSLAMNSQTVVIPNGIDVEKYKNISSPNKNILGTISRLDPHKNTIELINFMKALPDYKLLIAGDGEEMQMLKSIAPSNVEFLGFVSDIPNFLSKIDIYVSASLGEGLPYSVLEAIAAGKKVILSDVVGHRDLVSATNRYKLNSLEEFKKCLVFEGRPKLSENFKIAEMVKRIEVSYE